MSKIVLSGLKGVQKKNIPLSIAEEYANAEDTPDAEIEADWQE